jgi:two-component system, NtrC family, response regulator PilR
MTRVLVIEDQRPLLRNLERGLVEGGYEVVPAASVGEACEAVSRQPDLIVLDLMLPDGSGKIEHPGLPTLLHTVRGQGYQLGSAR